MDIQHVIARKQQVECLRLADGLVLAKQVLVGETPAGLVIPNAVHAGLWKIVRAGKLPKWEPILGRPAREGDWVIVERGMKLKLDGEDYCMVREEWIYGFEDLSLLNSHEKASPAVAALQ